MVNVKRIVYYKTQQDKEPFKDWLIALKDPRAKSKIVKRLIRLTLGNPGDHAACRDGVWELRIDEGPGYRVYYAWKDNNIYLILLGGDKRKQQDDIEQAIVWWKQVKGGKHEF